MTAESPQDESGLPQESNTGSSPATGHTGGHRDRLIEDLAQLGQDLHRAPTFRSEIRALGRAMKANWPVVLAVYASVFLLAWRLS